MLNSSAIFYYRLLDLNHFPLWVQDTKDFAGVYSLKLYVGLDAAMQWKANVGIIDAGSNLIRAPLDELHYVKEEGIYSPLSSGSVNQWVHPLSRDFLIHYGIVDSIDTNGRSCCGGHIFFDYRNSTVREKIIIPMQLCSYTHSLGQVNITVDYNGRVFHGMGLSTDVIESAALALLHAINNIERTKRIQELREPPKKIDDLVAEHKA